MNRQPSAGYASHVIPARLLAQFANPPGTGKRRGMRHWQVCRYSKASASKDIAISEFVENGFYSYVESDGIRNNVHESRMANEIEGPFNQLLPLFENSLYVPNRADGVVIARYIANIFNRTHQRRIASRMQQEETAEVTKELLADRRKVLQLTAAYSFLTQRAMPVESVVRGTSSLCNVTSEAKERQFLSNLQRHEESLFELLEGKPYGLLKAPLGAEFIISDTAVITRVPMKGGFSIGEGFSKPNVHTLLPVSSRTCLQVGLQNLDLRVLRPDEVDMINLDSIRLMHRWAYGTQRKHRVESLISDFGGTVRYKIDAFVTKKLTADSMLELLTQNAVDEALAGRPSLRAFGRLPRRRPWMIEVRPTTVGDVSKQSRLA